MIVIWGSDLYSVTMVQDVVSIGVGVVRRYQKFVLVVNVAVAAVGDKVLVTDLVMELTVGSDLIAVRVVVCGKSRGGRRITVCTRNLSLFYNSLFAKSALWYCVLFSFSIETMTSLLLA